MINFGEIKKANVYLRNSLAGELRKTGMGFEFEYHKNYLNNDTALPVSKTLSLRNEKYFSEELFPFFDNMILEGWLLNISQKTFHIDKNDRFALLITTGLDTIGAVTVKGILDGEEIDEKKFIQLIPNPELKPYELSSPYMEKVCPYTLEDLKTHPNISTQFAKKLWGFDAEPEILLQPNDKYYAFTLTISGGSISGAQKKGLFRLDTRKKMLIPGGHATTHIIKPKGDFPELPENEHLTMSIARKAGFEVPPVVLLNVEDLGNIFVIKRFDRIKKGKLMMEDMGQLLELESERKYKTSYEKIAKSIAKNSEGPKIQLAEFFKRLVFCYITANGDMHAKNWALLETQKLNGDYVMSPVYDFLNTRLPIPQENDELGLTLFGKQSNIQGSYFRKFAKEKLDLPEKVISNVFNEIENWFGIIEELTPRSALSEVSKETYLNLCKLRTKQFLDTIH